MQIIRKITTSPTALLVAMAGVLAMLGSGCETPKSFREPWFTDTSEGKLYRTRCASCHALRDPAAHTQVELTKAVQKFGKRARLSIDESADLERWLLQHASDATAQVSASAKVILEQSAPSTESDSERDVSVKSARR